MQILHCGRFYQSDCVIFNYLISFLGSWIIYCKIPKISPGAYIFQKPFLRGLFLEGPIFGRAYVRREICVSNSIGLACSEKEIYHFCFVLLCIRGQILSTTPPEAYIRRAIQLRVFCVTSLGDLYLEGLIH